MPSTLEDEQAEVPASLDIWPWFADGREALEAAGYTRQKDEEDVHAYGKRILAVVLDVDAERMVLEVKCPRLKGAMDVSHVQVRLSVGLRFGL
jgi:hypothetical protein